MHILLITWKTGEREWYSYGSKAKVLKAKEIWDQDDMVESIKAGLLTIFNQE